MGGQRGSQNLKLLLAPPMNLDLPSLHLNLHPGLQNYGCCHRVSKINSAGFFFPRGISVCVRISEKCWHFQSWLLCKAPHSNDEHINLSVGANLYCLSADCYTEQAPSLFCDTKNDTGLSSKLNLCTFRSSLTSAEQMLHTTD